MYPDDMLLHRNKVQNIVHAAVPYILHILSLKRGSQFSWTTKQIKAERIKLMGSRPLQRLSQDSKQQRKIEVTHFQVVQ